MKFAVGYRPMGSPSFYERMEPVIEHIAELYFPWPGIASGRAPIGTMGGYGDYTVQAELEDDLRRFHASGVTLDLLFNSNCMGEYAISEHLRGQVSGVIDHIEEHVAPVGVVTTASPAIAHIVKSRYPGIRTRASVNMRIGTVKGMQYLAHLFDEYLVQRDYNRDLARIETLCEWAAQNGKTLHMLANSGCMRFCSGQTFHDNMVAHGEGIDEVRNMGDFSAHTCWNYLSERANWVSVLQNTWVRPEDIGRYARWFPVVKLATRMHPNPFIVVSAYARGSWSGNLLDLMEPGYSSAFAPYVIDNTRFPADWHERVTACDKECHRCGYCKKVLETVLQRID
jgi:collagenase-like PrtC family protease